VLNAPVHSGSKLCSDSRLRKAPLWRPPVGSMLRLVIALDLTPSVQAQQKPFTEKQVGNMVRAGRGDDSGAKLIERRGIDFAPAEDFIQSLKASGPSEAFLNALRAAKPPEPASAKKPLTGWFACRPIFA